MRTLVCFDSMDNSFWITVNDSRSLSDFVKIHLYRQCVFEDFQDIYILKLKKTKVEREHDRLLDSLVVEC